jgi:DNA-binding LytR/AlgR family response regulator
MLPQNPSIILTTAFSDYALESYEFGVVDYLLKPFSFQRFIKALSKVPTDKDVSVAPVAISEKNMPSPELFIKSGYEYLRINVLRIVYIKADIDYVELRDEDKRILSSESLKYWEERLKIHQFVRIHKSYIINLTKIKKIVGNQVYLQNDEVIPIGRAYREALFNHLNVNR